MKIGICLPYMKAGLTREDYQQWFRAVDDGPFHSVCCGERVHGPTMDMRVVLAAAAMATRRVEITPTLYVLPMHSATRVAKEIASLDILSGAGSGKSRSDTAAGSRITWRWVRNTRVVTAAWTAR